LYVIKLIRVCYTLTAVIKGGDVLKLGTVSVASYNSIQAISCSFLHPIF